MTCKIDYTGNATIVAFPFPFAIPAETALEVRVNDAVRKEGFRINCAGSADGGVVVFDSAPAIGDVISLRYLGAVTIGVQDAAAGHLADKLVAGDGISLQTEADGTGVQRLRIGAIEPVDMLKKSENLLDVPNKAQACQNLGVYTAGQTDAAIGAAVSEVNTTVAGLNSVIGTLNNSLATVSGSVADLSGTVLRKANCLSEFSDLAAKAAARANLDIYSKVETDAADQAVRDAALLKAGNLSGLTDVAAARANLQVASMAEFEELKRGLRKAEDNLFLTTLRMIANAGSTYLNMVNGFSDEFEDVSGVAVNVAVGGAPFQNSQYTNCSAANAFDGLVNTWWASAEPVNASSGVCYVGYTLPKPMVVRRIRVTLGTTPSAWYVQYYNGAAWVTLSTINVTAMVMDCNLPAISAPSASWRLLSASNVTAMGGYAPDSVAVKNIELYTEEMSAVTSTGATYDAVGDFFTNVKPDSSISDMVLRSRLYTPMAQPAGGRIVAVVERLDPLVHGTDNSLGLSRDGGITFSDGPVQVEATGLNFDGHLCDIVSTTINLTGQPAGSAVRAEFKTLNGKKQRIHGWYVDLAL